MISASRGAVTPSRHRCDSCPSDEVVGGLSFDFEAVRTESRDRDAPRRLFEKWDLENGVINRRLQAEKDEKDRCGGGVLF